MRKLSAVWFRRDFRLSDNHALSKVSEWCDRHDGEWLAFYHLDPFFLEELTPHHEYFFQTLDQFRRRLKELHIPLFLVYGSLEESLEKLLSCYPNVQSLFYNLDEVGQGYERDQLAERFLASRGVQTYGCLDAHLHRADEVVKKDETPYQVYTPYYRTWRSRPKPMPYATSISFLQERYHNQVTYDEESELVWQNAKKQCSFRWKAVGEEAAQLQWKEFLEYKAESYNHQREFPARQGTSFLSPYLKTGSIGIRQIWHDLEHIQQQSFADQGFETFKKELAWREFYQMIHFHHPNCKDEEINEKYRGIEWNYNEQAFRSWCEGRTGFPIVDAAMRQLNETGWMHNRLRMITASFLTKDLLIDWRQGERYFQKMLIDYDESSNIGGWQWAASVGTDAVPYFRVFNPYRQSEKFDRNGEFIRTFVKELAAIPNEWIHQPHESKLKVSDYPAPLVNHSLQREKAIALFRNRK